VARHIFQACPVWIYTLRVTSQANNCIIVINSCLSGSFATLHEGKLVHCLDGIDIQGERHLSPIWAEMLPSWAIPPKIRAVLFGSRLVCRSG
jgi:hypothetical protein